MIKNIGLEVLHKIDWVSLRKASSPWCAMLTTLVILLLTPVLAAEGPGSLNAQLSPRDSNSVAIEQLLDGLHRAAAESDAQDYFARYTEEAVFLGTDANERWSIAEFKVYAAKPFSEGRGWRYDLVSRHLVPTGNPEIYGFDEVLSNEKLGLCRGSGLVVFDGARWRVAQYVLSMLIPNAIAASVGRETVMALKQVGQ